MQELGHFRKRWDFGSAGRFGVGMSAWYKVTDCPVVWGKNLGKLSSDVLRWGVGTSLLVAHPQRHEDRGDSPALRATLGASGAGSANAAEIRSPPPTTPPTADPTTQGIQQLGPDGRATGQDFNRNRLE